MEVNFYLRVITLKRVFTYLTYVLATFPVLTYGIRSVTMILWSTLGVILWGLNYTSEEEIGRSKKNSFTFFIISVSPFLYLVMSLFYSDNFSEGLKNIVQMLSLLIFPVISL